MEELFPLLPWKSIQSKLVHELSTFDILNKKNNLKMLKYRQVSYIGSVLAFGCRILWV